MYSTARPAGEIANSGERYRYHSNPMADDSPDDARCRCGHQRSAHRHYRGGTECALCLDCLRFRSADGRIRRLVAILRRRSPA
jgi:hypothetical protein